MSPRLRTALVVLLVIAAAAAVLGLTTVFGPPPRVEAPALADLAPNARSATDFADLACVHVGLASQAVQADAPAATVREELAAARVLAAEALQRDARFSALSGGVAALDEAVRNDDGPAAATGMRVALRECDQLSR